MKSNNQREVALLRNKKISMFLQSPSELFAKRAQEQKRGAYSTRGGRAACGAIVMDYFLPESESFVREINIFVFGNNIGNIEVHNRSQWSTATEVYCGKRVPILTNPDKLRLSGAKIIRGYRYSPFEAI